MRDPRHLHPVPASSARELPDRRLNFVATSSSTKSMNDNGRIPLARDAEAASFRGARSWRICATAVSVGERPALTRSGRAPGTKRQIFTTRYLG